MVVYDGFELLDLSGPASVFSTANQYVADAYSVHTVSLGGGTVPSSAGINVEAHDLRGVSATETDTVLVCGGGWTALRRVRDAEALQDWLRTACATAERYGSICAGALVLAASGQLDGHRATTHWAALSALTQTRPAIDVASDALYIRDGRVWTSAGVATGIDMALAIVEEDHGISVMGEVAKQLVVYARRPGGQSQYSNVLDVQIEAGDELRDLTAWIDAHIDRPLRVADLARQTGMTERTFYRRFLQEVGRTPARYIEETRMHRARSLLEEGAAVKLVAISVGYKSEASFRKVFQVHFGIPPSLYKKMRGLGPPDSPAMDFD